MSAADRTVAAIAERQHGVFSRAQALDAGLSPSGVARRVKDGRLRRVHRSVYALAGVPRSFEGRALAAILAAGDGACAAGLSAAYIWRFEGVAEPKVIDVMIFDRRGISISGVRVKRPAVFVRGDRTRVGSIPVTSRVRTIFDLADVLSAAVLGDVLDDAIRRGVVTLEALGRRLESVRRKGLHGGGTIADLLAARTAGVSESALEGAFLRTLHSAGLPAPVPQLEVRRPDGSLIGRVDFAYPHAGLAIELDGYAFHSSRARWQRDRQRQNDLVDAGWTVLRFTTDDLRTRPTSAVALVARALLGAASRTS